MPYICFTDESSLQPSPFGRYFVYGGLIVPAGKLELLSRRIDEARTANGYQPPDELKFETNSRPSNISPEQHKAAKAAVLRHVHNLGAKLVVYVVLHQLAEARTVEERLKWGADWTLYSFNSFLRERSDFGGAILDRLPISPRPYQYLRDKFERGVALTGRRDPLRLDRVHFLATSCQNTSHGATAIDVALGAFRYCLNAADDAGVARPMFWHLSRMMVSRFRGRDRFYLGQGLTIRPFRVTNPDLEEKYLKLIEHLNKLFTRAGIRWGDYRSGPLINRPSAGWIWDRFSDA
jgi:hypothetical protein